MRFLGFRVSDDMHQALLEYCHSEGITVTECLTKLVDGLLSGEDLAIRPTGLEGRVKALESMIEKLIKGQGPPLGGENPATREEEMEMAKEEIQALVKEALDQREGELVEGIAEAVKERIEKGEAGLKEGIAEVKAQVEAIASHANDRVKELKDVYAKLAGAVSSLEEQAQNRKVHATAIEMLSCPDCGPFFLNAVKAANEEMAKQAQAAAEAGPKRWLIGYSPYARKGFTWMERSEVPGGKEGYYKQTEDPAEVQKAQEKGETVIELEAE